MRVGKWCVCCCFPTIISFPKCSMPHLLRNSSAGKHQGGWASTLYACLMNFSHSLKLVLPFIHIFIYICTCKQGNQTISQSERVCLCACACVFADVRVWLMRDSISQVQRPTNLLSTQKPGSNKALKINEHGSNRKRRGQRCPMTVRPQGATTDANQEATWCDWGQINATAAAVEEQVLPPSSLPSSAMSD